VIVSLNACAAAGVVVNRVASVKAGMMEEATTLDLANRRYKEKESSSFGASVVGRWCDSSSFGGSFRCNSFIGACRCLSKPRS
jgi:hypothetical protein